MTPIRYHGQLVNWKDDRGFGFIKPDDGSKEIFIHISELKRAGRRPKVGDQIIYEQSIGADGRMSAVRASIQGVSPQPPSSRQHARAHQQKLARAPQKSSGNLGVLGTGIGFTVLVVMVLSNINSSPRRDPSSTASITQSPTESITQPECNIKGNISVSTGKKLYHVPGMEDYDSTVIDRLKGEKWFCSEAEAREAGWRKAPR